MNVSPIQIINDHLDAQGHDPYPSDRWRASSAGMCPRRVYLQRLQVPATQKLDERTKRVFSVGDVFHDWAQTIVDKHFEGADTKRELELSSDTLNVVGHVDQVVQLDRGWTLIDYKSQHSGAFTRAKEDGTMLKPWQRLQFGTYMLMLVERFPEMADTLATIAVYLSKDDLRVEQVLLPWNETLKRDVESYWNKLNADWTLQLPPLCECHLSDNKWMVKRCPYNPMRQSMRGTNMLPADTCCNDNLLGETFGHQITLEEVLV